jgi:predicted RNA-binding protein YlxR (DUF448 family)
MLARVIEKGTVHRHYTADDCIGIVQHYMRDAVPEVNSVINHAMEKSVSNEEELAKVLGVWNYPARVLASTQIGDIVLFNSALKEGIEWIDCHLTEVGLSHCRREDIVWDDDYKIMADFPNYKKSYFFFGPQAHSVCPDEARFEITQRMNHKNELIRLAQRLDVPTPQTFCFNTKEEIQDCKDLWKLLSVEEKVLVKISKSVSGLGISVCQSFEELEKEIERIPSGVEFQVQEYINGIPLSVQYGVANGKLVRIASTGQLLEDKLIHAGNWGGERFFYQPELATDPLAWYLYQKGIKGWFGFDVVAVPSGGGRFRYLVTECNPRYTGAAYYVIPAAKLQAKFWVGKNYRMSCRLEDLDLGELEYNPQTGEGWSLINWGPAIREGKGGFLYIGDPQKFQGSEERLRTLLE